MAILTGKPGSRESKKSMRILYHHRTQALDGQRVHIREIQDSLRSLGHEVFEVAPVSSREVAGSVPVPSWKRRLLSGIAGLTPRGAYEGIELAYNLFGYRNLCRAARSFRPDVIYERCNINTVAGVWAAKKLGLPLLLEVNAPLAEEKEKNGQLFFTGLAQRLENYVFRQAARVLPVTNVLARRITYAAGLPPEKVVVIQNGVRPERFVFQDQQRHELRRRLHLDDALVVGAVGFFRPWHGLDLLLKCLIQSPELRQRTRLLLVGDGPALPHLRTLATSGGIGDRMIFTGAIPHPDVPTWMAAMDVVLLARAVEYASPLKLFEYMAAGKAIVAPRQENLLEVLTEETDALCFSPEDHQCLTTALLRLLHDEPLRRRLGEEARRTIDRRRLTWDGNAARIVEVAQEILTTTSSPQMVNGCSSWVGWGVGR